MKKTRLIAMLCAIAMSLTLVLPVSASIVEEHPQIPINYDNAYDREKEIILSDAMVEYMKQHSPSAGHTYSPETEAQIDALISQRVQATFEMHKLNEEPATFKTMCAQTQYEAEIAEIDQSLLQFGTVTMDSEELNTIAGNPTTFGVDHPSNSNTLTWALTGPYVYTDKNGEKFDVIIYRASPKTNSSTLYTSAYTTMNGNDAVYGSFAANACVALATNATPQSGATWTVLSLFTGLLPNNITYSQSNYNIESHYATTAKYVYISLAKADNYFLKCLTHCCDVLDTHSIFEVATKIKTNKEYKYSVEGTLYADPVPQVVWNSGSSVYTYNGIGPLKYYMKSASDTSGGNGVLKATAYLPTGIRDMYSLK